MRATAVRGLPFEIVPSTEFAAIRERVVRESGGWYDPITGDLIAERRHALHTAILHELATSDQADVLMYLVVLEVSAQQVSGHASWDGVEQSTAQSDNALVKFLADPGNTSFYPALSLAVRIVDSSDQDLYARRAGVQLLRKSGAFKASNIADDTVLTDPVKNKDAIQLLLRELGEAPVGQQKVVRSPSIVRNLR